MTIIGKTALTRYRVEGASAAINRYLGNIRGQLHFAAFRPIDDSPGEESAFGFVRYSDYLSSDFSRATPAKEPYAAWKLRVDSRKIPAKLMAAEVTKGVRAYQEDERERIKKDGLILVTKDTRQEIRDTIKARLLRQTPPTPDTVDVVWDTQAAVLYMSGGSKVFRDALTVSFSKAFPDLSLARMTTDYLTEKVEMELPDDMGARFLTWLYYHTGRVFMDANRREFEIGFGSEMSISGTSLDSGSESITAKGDVGAMSAIREEIEGGKRIQSAQLVFSRKGEEWSFKLKGRDFSILSMAAPAVSMDTEDADDNDNILRESMHLKVCACEMLDTAFWEFVRSQYTMPDTIKTGMAM